MNSSLRAPKSLGEGILHLRADVPSISIVSYLLSFDYVVQLNLTIFCSTNWNIKLLSKLNEYPWNSKNNTNPSLDTSPPRQVPKFKNAGMLVAQHIFDAAISAACDPCLGVFISWVHHFIEGTESMARWVSILNSCHPKATLMFWEIERSHSKSKDNVALGKPWTDRQNFNSTQPF